MSVATSISYIDISNSEPDSIQARISAKSITIPAFVVEIANNSFENSILESITFMDDSQLKTIGIAAFKNCKFLKSIQIPPSVVEIADKAFFDSSIEEIIFTHDSQLKTIGNEVFRYCQFLKSIIIPDSLLMIGDSAFSNSSIQKLIFTDNSRLETINEYAFDNCKSLESIKIPSSVIEIGYSAFSESNIKQVIFPDDSKLEILSGFIFEKCVYLKSITLPASILEIDESAFSESGIEEILFSDNPNLKTIGDYVFIDCQFLKSITIPDSVTHIGLDSFKNSAIENVLFRANSQCITIGDSAFRNCRFLKSIEIPASVLKIGKSIFSNSSIQTLIFTDDSRLETIGEFAFKNCKSLELIKIPSSVVTINYSAFFESNIKQVLFSDDSKLEILSEYIFCRCLSLKSITLPTSILAINEHAFFESGIEEVLFAENSNLKTIGKGAFHQAKLSKPIKIPMSVVAIGEVAFKQCFITEIIFPENSRLRFIRLGAFEYCRFTSIIIPDSVVLIEERSFAGCDKLEEVIFSVNSSQLETIGEAAFLECSSLKSFIFPQSLREIGKLAFSLCNLPKSITLSSPSVEFRSDPFTKSGVDDIIFGNGEKIQTIDKNNRFLQICKEGDFSQCKEYLENNDINFSDSRQFFTEDAMSIVMITKNVDLIILLIKNKAFMYSKCKTQDIKNCFTDDIFESVFFESAAVFWYSIYSFATRKMYKFIHRLLMLLRSKEYVEEWVNIFRNSHQITPLRCVTQGDSFDLYHFLIDYDLVTVADLEIKTIKKYFQLAFKFGNVAYLKKYLGLIPKDIFSFKFTNFLMHAPQDKLYSLIEYTLPFILKNEDPLGFVVKGEYRDRINVKFPETVLSYLAYAQAFDAFKHIVEHVPNTQYTPSHLVACSLFRGYSDAKRRGNVDISNFMKLFDYILQDDIRPHVLGEVTEWVEKSIFTCIEYGNSEMCMKLFSYGFDKDDVYIDVISDDEHNSLIRYSLLSYACKYQPLEIVQFLINTGSSINGILPTHINSGNDSSTNTNTNTNTNDQNRIDIACEDEDEDEIQCESKSRDKHMSDDDSYDDSFDNNDDDSYDDNDDGNDDDNDDGNDDDNDDDIDDEYTDVTNSEKFVFRDIDLKDTWFEPYFNPYRLNKNQDVEIYYKGNRPFDPSVEDPLERFQEHGPSGYLTLLNVTPLGTAIYAQNLDLVRLLLKNGANPNANTFSGFPHLFVLSAGKVIDLDHKYSRERPEVEYPIIDVPSDMEDKKEMRQMEQMEQEKRKKMKMENNSEEEDEDISVSTPVPDTKFAIFQELVNYGADLFHEQAVRYVYNTIALRKFSIYDLCTHLNYPLDLLKYLQTIPQLCDKIKTHYIHSFRPTFMDSYYVGDPFFPADTVDYMFQKGYLNFETYKEDEEFLIVLQRHVKFEQDLKLVLEKYGFHFADLIATLKQETMTVNM